MRNALSLVALSFLTVVSLSGCGRNATPSYESVGAWCSDYKTVITEVQPLLTRIAEGDLNFTPEEGDVLNAVREREIAIVKAAEDTGALPAILVHHRVQLDEDVVRPGVSDIVEELHMESSLGRVLAGKRVVRLLSDINAFAEKQGYSGDDGLGNAFSVEVAKSCGYDPRVLLDPDSDA